MMFHKHKIQGTTVNGDIKRAVVLFIHLTKISSCHMEQQKAALTNKPLTREITQRVQNNTTCAPVLASPAWVCPALFLTWSERIPNFSESFCLVALWEPCSVEVFV